MSGLPATKFAAELGVNPKTFKWWRTQLALTPSEDATKPALARRREEPLGKATPSLNFIEMTAAIEGDALEVVLPSNLRVRVRPGFDMPTLVRLLDVLDSRRR